MTSFGGSRMDIHPKALICEILSGFTLLGLILWSYFQVHPVQLNWMLSPPPNVSPIIVGFSAVGFFVSWIIGRFIETTRDGLVERLFDWFSRMFSGERLNWDFFFNTDREKVEQLNDWYYSYYCLDINFVIGIIFFFIIELMAWQTRCEFISPLPSVPNVILLIVVIIFGNYILDKAILIICSILRSMRSLLIFLFFVVHSNMEKRFTLGLFNFFEKFPQSLKGFKKSRIIFLLAYPTFWYAPTIKSLNLLIRGCVKVLFCAAITFQNNPFYVVLRYS